MNPHAYYDINMSINIKHIINKPTVAESAIRHSRDEVRKLRRQVLHHKVKNKINTHGQLADFVQSHLTTKTFNQADYHVHAELNLESK